MVVGTLPPRLNFDGQLCGDHLGTCPPMLVGVDRGAALCLLARASILQIIHIMRIE